VCIERLVYSGLCEARKCVCLWRRGGGGPRGHHVPPSIMLVLTCNLYSPNNPGISSECCISLRWGVCVCVPLRWGREGVVVVVVVSSLDRLVCWEVAAAATCRLLKCTY